MVSKNLVKFIVVLLAFIILVIPAATASSAFESAVVLFLFLIWIELFEEN